MSILNASGRGGWLRSFGEREIVRSLAAPSAPGDVRRRTVVGPAAVKSAYRTSRGARVAAVIRHDPWICCNQLVPPGTATATQLRSKERPPVGAPAPNPQPVTI